MIKPYYSEPNITIYNGDCLEIMKDIEDKSIDMILCDLPYGTTACKWDTIIPFEPLWNNYKRIIKDNGAIVLTASQPFTTDLINSNRDWFKYELIWIKNFSSDFMLAKLRPMQYHENILIFAKSKTIFNPQKTIGAESTQKRFKKPEIVKRCKGTNKIHNLKYIQDNFINPLNINPKSYLEFGLPAQSKRLHTSQKPLALFEYLIKTYTNEGDLVLDNCLGSGTTAIACLQTNRNFMGIELLQEYCVMAQNRINNFTKQLTLEEK